jgi:hypothetical protein
MSAREQVEALVDRAPPWKPLSHLASADKPPSPAVRKLAYVLADDLPAELEVFNDELIEGVMGRAAMAVLYGDSNSGKTFLAIDLGAAVGRLAKWMGRNTAGGLVVYLATEGPASVEMRLRAYRRHHGVSVPGFVIVKSPINLFDGAADIAAVLALVEEIEQAHSTKAALIIGDTLARISAGANENSGEDMGVVLRNADAIRSATGATFLWIHHCGKDQARGMRGWSGMRAAIDTEIEVTADEATGIRTAEITKQRDLPGKGERFGFKLEPVHLGTNQWGGPRGSCAVIPADAPPKAPGPARRQSEVAGAIVELLTSHGTGMKKTDIVKHFEGRHERGTVYRELKKMLGSGRLHEVAGVHVLRQPFIRGEAP